MPKATTGMVWHDVYVDSDIEMQNIIEILQTNLASANVRNTTKCAYIILVHDLYDV